MSLTSKTEPAIPLHTEGLKSKKEVYFAPREKNEPYYVDTYSLQRLIEIHRRALSYYNGMAQSFKSLELGPVTMEILQKLQDNDLSEFKKRFFARIEAELDKAGIRNEQIRINLREGTDRPWNIFEQSIETNQEHVKRIRVSQPGIRLDLNNYSVNNNEVVFSEADQQRLRDTQATVYLDTQAKQSFSMLVETILSNLSKLNIICERNGIKAVFGHDQVIRMTNTPQKQEFTFNKTIINRVQL